MCTLMLKDQVSYSWILEYKTTNWWYINVLYIIHMLCQTEVIGFLRSCCSKNRENALWLISLFFRGIFRKGTTKKKSWYHCFGPGMWKRWWFTQVEEGEN